MQREAIFEEVKGILKQIKPSADFSNTNDNSQLVRDLGLDSLTILLLSLAIETQFGFKFDGNPQFATVGEVLDYISSHTTR
jgi:acyl carrier protein